MPIGKLLVLLPVLTGLLSGDVCPRGSLVLRATSEGIHQLPDGRIVVVSGQEPGRGLSESAEIFDPRLRRWTLAPGLPLGRYYHASALLPKGDVLVIGGYAKKHDESCALLDVRTGRWTMTGAMNLPRAGHLAVTLRDGRVLVWGGYSGTAYPTSSETYDPKAGTWKPGPDTAVCHSQGSATVLPDGRVLTAGGYGGEGGPTKVAELFDLRANEWRPVATLHTARYHHAEAVLPD